MSFEFTVLSDDRFIEILQAWVDSPWPKTAEDGYAYETASDGHPQGTNRMFSPLMSCLMTFPLASPVGRV